jgi:hypothetical protein
MTAETILFWVAVLLAASSFNMLMTVATRGQWSPFRARVWHRLARTEGEAFARNTFLLVSLGTGILAAMLLLVRSRL